MISPIFSSPILRGAPGRGSSKSPSSPRSAKRRRHLPTVFASAPTRSTMALFSSPSAAASTIRARRASPWAVFRRRAKPSSSRRSTSDNVIATAALLTRQTSNPTDEHTLTNFSIRTLVDSIRQELQSVLRLSAPPSPSARFFDLGMDSLMAVELRNRLNRGFTGAYVASNTVVFDYPDAAALAHFLAGELGELGASDAPKTDTPPVEQPKRRMPHQPTPPPSADDRVAERDGIAIVGMACRFPGAADLAAFWNQLAAGVDVVTDRRPDSGIPPDPGGDPGFANAAFRCGGFVAGIDEFDARFFGIRPIEARTIDPQQRMLLETSWQALEDAGMDPGGLKGSRTGVYVGISGSEYETGLPIAFAGLFAGETRRRISVPGYPFERRRYWVDSPKA